MSIKFYFEGTIHNTSFLMEELSYYFGKMYQIKIEEATQIEEAAIVLQVTPNQQELDQIHIELVDGKGIIESNTPVGLLIALYRLFKEMGVRYLRPGKENEWIPTLSKDAFTQFEMHLTEEASYKHRGVCIEGADSFENTQNFIDWLPKIGMNSFFIQFENPYSFFKRWYEHEFNPYLEKESFSNEIAQEMSDLIDEEMLKRGLVHHRVGHGWTSEVLGYSSKYGWESNLILPEEKKPLVAELNGERELYATAPILTSLDFANPEVAEKMIRLIVDYAKNRQDVDYLHVWLSDARNNICECADCQKEIPSDQYVKILNQLDEALTQEGLATKICFLLYHELLFAPETQKLINPERFTLMFAPITRTFEMSYADVDYENNIPAAKKYVRNKIDLPNSLEENLSYLLEWQKDFKGDSFVYDYPLGRAHYGDLGYMKISKVIYRDIKYLDQLHLNGYISCQELRAGFPHNFPNYVMGQMLWDNTLDYAVLEEEYFASLYGKEWQQVVQYLTALSNYSSCDYFNAIGERLNPVLSARYATAVHLANERLTLIAENTAQAAAFHKQQWLQLGYHREFVMKLGKALELLSQGQEERAQNQWKDFLDYIRRNELQIQENLDVYRIIEVAKNYAGFKL